MKNLKANFYKLLRGSVYIDYLFYMEILFLCFVFFCFVSQTLFASIKISNQTIKSKYNQVVLVSKIEEIVNENCFSIFPSDMAEVNNDVFCKIKNICEQFNFAVDSITVINNDKEEFSCYCLEGNFKENQEKYIFKFNSGTGKFIKVNR